MANYNQVNISSGHSVNCKGASGIIDEVTEAIKVVNKVAEMIKKCGKSAYVYHDKASNSSTNLANIVNWHNGFKDGVDVSVHFNSAADKSAHGVEVLHYGANTQALATAMSSAIAKAGKFTDRGHKVRTGLYVLRNTKKPCILIEVCFVGNSGDVANYKANFDAICRAICKTLIGVEPPKPAPAPPKPQEPAKPAVPNVAESLYRVVVDNVQIGAYKNVDNMKEEVQKAVKAGKKLIKVEKVN